MNAMDSPELLKAALMARTRAYAPYSGFVVGAAVEAGSGRIYSGCNVENASFGLKVCAERIAIFNAIAAGETNLRRLLAVADTAGPVYPCGACRQVMQEFNISEVILCNVAGSCRSFTLPELLPYGFSQGQMEGAARNE